MKRQRVSNAGNQAAFRISSTASAHPRTAAIPLGLSFDQLMSYVDPHPEVTPNAWRKALDRPSQLAFYYQLDLRCETPSIVKAVRVRPEKIENGQKSRLIPTVFIRQQKLAASYVQTVLGKNHLGQIEDLIRLLEHVGAVVPDSEETEEENGGKWPTLNQSIDEAAAAVTGNRNAQDGVSDRFTFDQEIHPYENVTSWGATGAASASDGGTNRDAAVYCSDEADADGNDGGSDAGSEGDDHYMLPGVEGGEDAAPRVKRKRVRKTKGNTAQTGVVDTSATVRAQPELDKQGTAVFPKFFASSRRLSTAFKLRDEQAARYDLTGPPKSADEINYWKTAGERRLQLCSEADIFVDQDVLTDLQEKFGPGSQAAGEQGDWHRYAWRLLLHLLGGEKEVVRAKLAAKKIGVDRLFGGYIQALLTHVEHVFDLDEPIDLPAWRHAVNTHMGSLLKSFLKRNPLLG
ncbi:hypothetical protein BV898_17718 [Hypsibius exemplaris]|uniref:Uncharacterized protein n=1 Tax=Hypsibius exemplaris TaxID=2072580 RepID=A0A9X6RMP9_HYPEX|nr:hypothetical protein BV898_17718 [Hypsibius exemplaris]